MYHTEVLKFLLKTCESDPSFSAIPEGFSEESPFLRHPSTFFSWNPHLFLLLKSIPSPRHSRALLIRNPFSFVIPECLYQESSPFVIPEGFQSEISPPRHS